MTAKEINQRIESGETMTCTFGLRSKNRYTLGGESITERQFNTAREKYKERLTCDMDFGGITKHHYTLK